MPKEKESEASTSSATSTTGSAAGGLLNLIKKTTGIGATETEGPISPPESEATSPALAPSDKARFTPAPIATNTSNLKPLSPPLSHPSSPTSPIRSISPPSPTIPARQFALGGSPARISASSTQIFERNVQEAHAISAAVASNGAPATVQKIPAHIATENHIPAVLEASSIAITDGSIDPDSVEIAVMTSHQSVSSQASNSLHPHKDSHGDEHTGATTAVHPPSTSHSQHSQHSSSAIQDKRRLSFISFSDIVQAEQADLLDSTILSPNPSTNVNPGFPAATVIDQVGISGITETLLVRRSPSPRYGASSPPRTSAGLLPGVGQQQQEGVVVETLGQSIRKTGSGDLGKGF